ncbi:hypothetical protein ACFFOU_05475 [Pseudonocardia sulfidoxydans]
MTASAERAAGRRTTQWAEGPILFSGGMLVITGIFQVFTGVMALAHDRIYEGTPGYLFAFDLTVWGWVLFAMAILSIAAGFGALRGLTWARVAGIAAAALSTVVQFMFLPYYPVWSVIVIVVDVLIVWGLASYRRPAV